MAKVQVKQRAAVKKERRLAAMTPEERTAYDAWQKTHRPGSPGERARQRADRKAAEDVRKIAARPVPPPSPDVEDIRQLIEFAKQSEGDTQTATDEAKFQGAFA